MAENVVSAELPSAERQNSSAVVIALEPLFVRLKKGKRKWFFIVMDTVVVRAIVVPKALKMLIKTDRTSTTGTSTTTTTTSIDKTNATWAQHGITVAGGDGPGDRTDQLNTPVGLDIDNHCTLYIADARNARIVQWRQHATEGEVVFNGSEPGNPFGFLAFPTDVIVDEDEGALIVCDAGNSQLTRLLHPNVEEEPAIILRSSCYALTMDQDGAIYILAAGEHSVKLWKKGELHAKVIAGGNGPGDLTNQFSEPHHLFVAYDYSIYISDTFNNRVVKWMKDATHGTIVAGQGATNNLTDLYSPAGLAVDHSGDLFVVDFRYKRVTRFSTASEKLSAVAGGNGAGSASNQLHDPDDLSFDWQGNLYVVDSFNHRVQKFPIIKN